MKTTFINRALGTIAILTALLFTSQAFAASDYLLEIEGIKGECKGKHIKLTENADGSFSAENIPGGTYKVVYTAKAGKTGSTKRGDGSVTLAFEGVIAPRDVATGQSSGKRISAPRDVATGQSSGKRQHKPVTITKEWDASTPTLILGQIVVGDVDGDAVAGQPDPVHGVVVKRGVESSSTSAPVKAGYDLKLNKKV